MLQAGPGAARRRHAAASSGAGKATLEPELCEGRAARPCQALLLPQLAARIEATGSVCSEANAHSAGQELAMQIQICRHQCGRRGGSPAYWHDPTGEIRTIHDPGNKE